MRKITGAFAAILIIAVFASCNDSTSPNNNNNTNPTTGYNNVSGTITLTIHASGGKSTPYGSETLTKNENIAVDLSFVLPLHAMTHSGASTTCQWQNQPYGGTSNWFEETLTEYDCNGGRATDKDTMIKSFSTNIGGEQPGGVGLVIGNDGTYQITVTASYTQTSMNVYHSIFTNCGQQTFTSNSGMGPGVPFQHDFTPFASGAPGSFTGKTETSNPAHLKGTFNGTDNLTLFTNGATSVLFPYDYVVTWDLNMIK